MMHSDRKTPLHASTWAVLGVFLILWAAISVPAFVQESAPAAIVISLAALIPLGLCGTLIALRDRRRVR
jgi:uncharacterized membrane protein